MTARVDLLRTVVWEASLAGITKPASAVEPFNPHPFIHHGGVNLVADLDDGSHSLMSYNRIVGSPPRQGSNLGSTVTSVNERFSQRAV